MSSLVKKIPGLIEGSRKIGHIRLSPHATKTFTEYKPVHEHVHFSMSGSEEMKTARAMNRNALREIKSPVARSYSEATAEDLKRLTSTTIEDSYSRAVWTNPKDGKVYNILKQGETKDGKIAVRILNENGGFVKEAELSPKIIGIPDNYTGEALEFGLPHGAITTIFAKRANPFAKYVPFAVTKEQMAQQKELEGIWDYLNNGGKLDYLSCSYSANVYSKRKIQPTTPHLQKMLEDQRIYDRLTERVPRIFCAASNTSTKSAEIAKEFSSDLLVLNQKVEGVGALNPKTGKISDFSCSRNSSLTQHYEVGEFTPRITPHGINITGTSGTDIEFPSKELAEKAKNPLINKTTERIQQLLDAINDRVRDFQKAKAKLFTSGKPITEVLKEKALLEQQQMIYSNKRRKVFDYMSQLKVVDGKYQIPFEDIIGTSVATPVRTAKIALNDMLEGIL